MVDSLKAQGFDFKLWVLCLTDECRSVLDFMNYPEIECVNLQKLESDYPELKELKKNRSTAEYYFTLSPLWPKWLFDNKPYIESITYLDADLEFHSSPQPLIDEAKDCSIGIIEHRFHPTFDISKYSGKFNVAWVHFKKDKEGLSCLNKWCDQCLDWCSDQPADGKFADQKYLDSWPDEFSKVHIYSNPGANLAPWNLNTHEITCRNGKLYSNNQKIIFYHFHMIKAYDGNHLSTSLDIYRVDVELKKQIVKYLYRPYIKKLLQREKLLGQLGFKTKAFQSCREYSELNQKPSSDSGITPRVKNGDLVAI